MKKLFASLVFVFMLLGTPVSSMAYDLFDAVSDIAALSEDISDYDSEDSLPVGVKIGGGIVGGCLISLFIVMGMVRSMNTAREATQANNYYSVDDVRVAVSSDRYTHTTRRVYPRTKKN